MKITSVLILLLFAFSVHAQSAPPSKVLVPACGPADTRFDVKTDKHQHPVAQPSEGKALVYFIEDDSLFDSLFKPTTRAGLDGAWLGATHGNSYFYFSVEPGVHHLCVSWQPSETAAGSDQIAAAHFSAQAGDVLYYRVRNYYHVGAQSIVFNATIDLEPLDSDEAQLLMSKFRFCTSRARE